MGNLLTQKFLGTLTRCQGSLVKDNSLLRFTHHLYNASIYENSAPRTYTESPVRMGIILPDPFWDVKYKIVSGDDDGLFKAEEVTVGDFCFLRIKTRSSNSAVLNREVRDIYTLTIEATESTYDNRARTKVSIQVLDTNDLKPLFYPASYHVLIKEDTPIKSSLVGVSATDADIGSNAEFYYSITTRSHPFAIDPFTGTITLIKTLDASQRDRYELTVLAEDRAKKISGVQKFGNVAKVVVTIQNVRENFTLITPSSAATPQTDDDKISLNIKMEPKEKEKVASLSIVEGDPLKCFQFVPSMLHDGGFQLVSTKWIDWSQNPFGLNISLQAKDRGNPPLLTPIKTVHIPPPPQVKPLTFEQELYYVTLSEFSPPKSHVVRVSVGLSFKNITYSIKENLDSYKFKISAQTGVIMTSQTLDFEKHHHYEFDVTANDGEAFTRVVVDIIDENDNSPRFTLPSYQASLAENVPIGTSIFAVSAIDVDKDNNGFVTYSIANTGPVPFIIDPLTGVISTSQEFDYELMKRWYHLRIWASDSGSPFNRVSECSATITMTNVNDNAPVFERVACNASIHQDFAVGESIVEMSALDLDELQQIIYRIESGNDDGLFAINPVSGSVKLAKAIPSNNEGTENPLYILKITATDGKYSANPNTVTVRITSKGEGASTHCEETGITRQLTEKLIESFKPSLNSKEEEYISDVHIINQHSPKFITGTPSSIDIREDFALNRSVLQFNATDNDSGFNRKLVYAISSGNEDGCFTIDMNTGELKVISALDREQKEFYILNITVYDLGSPQTSTWKLLAVNVLDANDNPPLFSQPRYVVNIPENTEVNKSIFKVNAIDLDSGDNGAFKYSLLTFTDLFKIDEVTGVVKVTGPLDRETFSRYDLTIEASDQAKLDPQLFSFTDLMVVLEDINDNPPKFVPTVYRIKVPEDVPPGTVLLWVESFDLDLESGGLISYNLKNSEAGMFFLDTSTGCLTLEHELDFEKQQFYNLTVRAVDHGKPRSLSSSCFIEVEVLDVNENLNRPLFTQFVHKAAVMEDATVGTSVLTITALDNDLGRDGVVRYYIHDGSGLGIFTIEEETGVIRTAGLLDREAVPHYWLTVYAKDLGTVPLVSWTEVYTEVWDINDNPPELSQPVYFGSVQENLPKDKSVLKVSATDMDKSSEGKLAFQILDSQRVYFTIDTKTGVISTLAPLDREQKAEHIIEVMVSDKGAPPLSSTATVVIEVLDENDNSPQFSHKLFQVKLPERQSMAEPQEIYRMVARDDDVGPSGMITYSLEDGSEDRFDIHPETGVVTARGEFVRGNYSILTIQATDHGHPPRMSKARLHVEWLPQPEPSSDVLAFDEPPFNYVVMETDPVTDMVGIIQTEIPKNLLLFDIIGRHLSIIYHCGDEKQDFYIEKNTGSIVKARRLDAGRKSHYNLTVRVTDGFQSITTQAYIQVVDINEHRPMFLKSLYEVRVPEDTSPWKEILHISAHDVDANSGLYYSIHSSLNPDSPKYFHLDQRSGVLVMKEELDYETISTHTLIVMVRDEKIPIKKNFAKVVVHVEDCNDHNPSFLITHYEGTMSNLALTGTEVLRVKALDKDTGSNAEIVYSFHSGGNVDGAFEIDQDTGSIRVCDALDKLPQKQYHLTVKATDQGFPQRSALCPVTITVKLSEFTPPRFSSEEYITEISETMPPDSPALSVSASCPSSVMYRINDGDPNGTFHININSGLLSVRNALDFEQHSSYRLTVRATNTAGVSSDAVVYIYVIDENDNAPVFHQDTYYGQISESAPVNSMVTGENNTPLVIKASDADKDTNALLIFQILEPAAQKVFKIDPSMGTISLKSTVDFEATPEYFFSVQVWDSGEPPLSASKPCRVNIRVLDINDCPPKFVLPVYETALTLPVFEDMNVIQVTAHDADSAVAYIILESTNKNAFKIDQSTGIISVNDSSELQSHNELKITTSDGLYKDTTIVKFNITNATKSSLKFEDRMHVATVLENSTSIKMLAVLKATGSYLNEPLQYTVLNPHGKFAVVPSSGVLQTTGVPFDREERDKYDVAVEVRDMRHPPRVDITHVKVYIDDINDNAPEISNLPHSLMISDETEPGDVLFQVLATDNDSGENGSILFSLEDDFGLFRIDHYLGDVSLLKPLDFESLNKYVLTVLASDEGETSLSAAGTLYVQVQNRSHPIFQSLYYPLKLPENMKPFTTILHVQARNPDGYRLIYNLEEDNASRFFNIDFKTGVLSVTDFLDFETQAKHILTVRATDSVTGTFAEAKVEIDVEDINDNAPVFQSLSYVTDMSEGLPIGTSVLQVSAFDKDSGRNSDITYQLVDKENEFFEIDPLSGILASSQVLDYETTQQFTLKVKATDKGAPPLSGEAQIIVNVIDVNDNPPDFNEPSYRASLDEKATCGHIIIKVQASDPDNKDDLQYKILSGNEGRYFSINESSGLISFSNVCKRNLDPFYNLTVAVSDGVFQKTAPVNIDMTNGNKHSPNFSQNIYEADLAENAEVGTRVIRLAAIDPDDGPYGSVDYTIINKLADEKFSIDEDGQIVTSQSLDRENPSQRVIAIKVMAKDGGGRVGFCTVKIILTDENDNAPQFKASEYQVSIQSTVNKGSPVIQIMAYDADEGKNADVTYTVEEAEEVTEDIIELNPFTGVVSIKESLVGLENKIFSFKVKARDGGIPFYNSSVPVQVKVVPPEVTLPQFTEPLYSFSASEDLPIGYEIGTVKADTDMPLIYSLVNGNTIDSNKEHVFAVDKDSGALVMQKNIDHEKTKVYKIDVIAQGNHNGTDVASLVSVHIEVQDVNDNQPVFEADPYEAFLAENLPPGTTVIQVTANDVDTNVNGKVSYTLEPNSDDIGDMFTIDSQTGWITTLKKANSETKQLYRLSVVATDHGDTVKLSSSVLVEVTITDENDNPPQFTEELYQGSILENSRPGETIVTLTTADKDVSAENRQIVCYITDGDPLGQFSVTAAGEEWTVISKSPLDREDKDKYTLKIIATDGRFQTSANVEVHVLDLNDNSPLCEQLLYTEAIMENSPSGLFILKISASDPDIGTNGQVSFTLHGPNADKFHLDSKTGELFTLAVLDRERETEYDLVVKATDGGGRSCQADVTLMVQDMNDNPPQFSTSHYEITVFDNTTIRTPIAVIYAKDPDTGINSEVRYSLQGADSGYFSLDEISGILRLERSLADETKATYEMKVKATDRGLPRHLFSFATITVHVVVLSDYQPLFLSSEYSLQIPESMQIGSEVISVSALTKDDTESEPVRYTIISGNEDGRFQINPMTGLLSLNSVLDFELCREYYLSVEGARGKPLLSDIATVIINITDVNDNPPVFNRSSYSSVIAEDISPGDMVLQVLRFPVTVRAIDLDGPPNNFIIYSIVSGDPQQQFSIDPHTGHITVRSMLDREEITHYSLTMQAADEGDPPLSSAVQVTVTVSDVNDSPPMFSQINHSLVLQEGEAVGSGILQLLVTDRDTPQNGPPFSFHIVSGNEDRSFHIDQGGLLSVSSPLRRRGKPQHLLKIQVTDSGHPPLSSICVVKINITEQSRYLPTVTPLEVFITTAGGVFSKRVIGKLHATDQDPQDVLSYKLVSDGLDQGLFSVDAVDGKIMVEKNLDPGLYHLNVSVSDGKFSIWAGVKVHVWAPSKHDLDQGFTLQLAGLSAEEFVSDHWRGLQRSLGLELNIPRQELRIASLQQQPNSINMEVLLVRRAQDGSVQPMSAQRLTGVLSTVEDTLGLNVLRLKHDGCVGAGCPPRGCRNAVVMRQGRMSNYATARVNFITPQHSWESVCSCNESAVRFDGKGYLKYLYQMEESKENFHLSLRLKTSAAEGTVMSSNASDWAKLEVRHFSNTLTKACGNMLPASLHVAHHPVADGRWHHVSLEVNGSTLRLAIDASHSNSVVLPQPCRLSQSAGALVLANSNPSTDAGGLGFTGCLESVQFNGEAVRGEEGMTGTGPQTGRLFGIYQCCSDVKICASNPCENGGTCVEDPSGGGKFHCSCPLPYSGSRCENGILPDDPCASQPCANGLCMPNNQGYICNCSAQIAGNRCQNACTPNACREGFECSIAGNSIHCERNTSPSYVEIAEICAGILLDQCGALTHSYIRNTSPSYVEIAEICAGILGLVLLVMAFVCFRKHYVSRKKHKSGCVQDSNGYFPTLPKSMMKETEISSPMEISTLIGSTGDLDNSPFRSLKPREQRELGLQVGSRSQRPQGPVICSVAPNRPPPPSTSSDNDSIMKNNWEHDYEGEFYLIIFSPLLQALHFIWNLFDIVESTYSTASTESRRNSRFGGFPFPLDRADRRAPLPPCYSNQNLDDFLGPDGLPLPSSQCPNEYTAISYYPTQHTCSLDNVSSGHKRLSVRLSVAQPSYADGDGSTRPGSTRRTPRSYAGSDMVESDYGSCEEVMF
uniref:Protocadherin Fat 2-like n=1 Tax=Sinocyclocheilus anshuiensis TaxID=1608454 RepID=A0A671Q6N2_9TELE